MERTLPVFINCRDQVSTLRKLVHWFESVGCERIILIDNDSTYPPLLDYYKASPHTIVKLATNALSNALWSHNVLDAHCRPDERYIYTDPDVLPTEDCPGDVIRHLSAILDRHDQLHKVGLGLKIDDLPEHYKFKNDVIILEGQFWKHELEPGLYAAGVATTFALYRGPGRNDAQAARTGAPYLARHEPWYINSAQLSEEQQYYRTSSGHVSNWSAERIPTALREAIDRMKSP